MAILAGGSLLALPVCSSGEPIPLIDAFFTAMSAVCVTGLSVVDMGTGLSPFGQAVVLLLIQYEEHQIGGSRRAPPTVRTPPDAAACRPIGRPFSRAATVEFRVPLWYPSPRSM